MSTLRLPISLLALSCTVGCTEDVVDDWTLLEWVRDGEDTEAQVGEDGETVETEGELEIREDLSAELDLELRVIDDADELLWTKPYSWVGEARQEEGLAYSLWLDAHNEWATYLSMECDLDGEQLYCEGEDYAEHEHEVLFERQ